MKNKLTLLLTFAVAIFFSSCEKDKNLAETKTIKIDPTEQKILDFKEKMKNPQKSDETMSIEDAVWNIEAALNYTYCIVSEENVKSGADLVKTVSMETENNYSGGNISINEVISIYNEMKNIMNAEFEETNSRVKFYTIADVKYENNVFILKALLRYINSDKGSTGFYVITHDWEWGYEFGRCDGTCQGQDLLTEIVKWINRNRPILANVYYTDVSWEGWFVSYEPILLNHSDWTNLAPYGVNMFYTEDPNGGPHYCIPATQGEYYASETNQALSAIEQYITDPGRKVTDWYINECSETNNYTTKGHVLGANTGEAHVLPPIQ